MKASDLPSPSKQPTGVIQFGGYQLDLAARELRAHGAPVSLEPKVFDLIGYLVSQCARVVSRDELFAALWPDEVVTEGVLSQAIWGARRALGDHGRRQEVIRTYHRRGYRFVARVDDAQRPEGSLSAQSASELPSDAYSACREGDGACADGRFADAVRHYDAALRCTRVAAMSAGTRTDPRRMCELHLARGRALWGTTAHVSEPQSSFRLAAGLARAVHSARLLARAAIGYAGGDSPSLFIRTVGRVEEEEVALLREALEALGSRDLGLSSALHAILGLALDGPGGNEESDELTLRAVTLARRCGDDVRLAGALLVRTSVIRDLDRDDERLAWADEAIAAGRAAGSVAHEAYGRHARAAVLLERADVDAADDEMSAMERLNHGSPHAGSRILPLLYGALRLTLAGRFAAAEAEAARALAIGEPRNRAAAQMYGGMLVAIRFLQGRSAEIRPVIEGFADTMPRDGQVLAARALVLAELGEVATARRAVRVQTAELVDDPRDDFWLNALESLGTACSILADRPSAARLYEAGLPYARRVNSTRAVICFGSVSRVLGLLATTLGRLDEAVDLFDAAITLDRRIGATAFVLLDEVSLAAALAARRSQGDLQRAVSLLNDAEPHAEKLGMGAVTSRARAVRGRLTSGTK